MGISLCIATYNRLSSLKDCINSIIDKFEGYPYEIVVADGGSKDGTLEYLRELDHVNLIGIGKLTGGVNSYNTAFKAAKMEYIALLNDDFVIYPNVFVKACKLMDENPDIALVSPKMLESIYSNYPNIVRDHGLVLYKSHIIRTPVFKEIGFFDTNFKTYNVDLDTFYSVLKRGHTVISTIEPAIIHNRVFDILRKDNKKIVEKKEELEYYNQKWKTFFENIENYLSANSQMKHKYQLFSTLWNMARFRLFHPLMKKQYQLYVKTYDWLMQECVIFKDKKYDHLKDFFLAQKIPKEIL